MLKINDRNINRAITKLEDFISIFSDDGLDKRALEILGSFLSTVTGVPSARDHRLLMEKVKILRLKSKGIEQLIKEQNSENHHILETFHFIEKSVKTLSNGLQQISDKASVNTGDIAQLMAPMNIYMHTCLLYTSPSPRDRQKSRMPSSA